MELDAFIARGINQNQIARGFNELLLIPREQAAASAQRKRKGSPTFLARGGRAPARYVLLSDFQSFELHDLDEGIETNFTLADLPSNVEVLRLIIGVRKRSFRDQDQANIEVRGWFRVLIGSIFVMMGFGSSVYLANIADEEMQPCLLPRSRQRQERFADRSDPRSQTTATYGPAAVAWR